jgi:hypothetical protein
MDLELGVWNFSGAWMLVLGILLAEFCIEKRVALGHISNLGGEMAEWFKAHAWKELNAVLHISSHVFQPCIHCVL